MVGLTEKLMQDESEDQAVVEHKSTSAKRALAAVESKSMELKKKGMSRKNFFLGVANCLFVAWSFGAIPEHFWLVYVFEVLVLFPLRFYNQASARPKENAYWLDFCWVANFSGVGGFVVLALDMLKVIHMPDRLHMFMFAAAWGCSNGPLLMIMGLLGNALIFHDADNVASVLIHLFPSLVMYTLRWDAAMVHARWPLFRLDYLQRLTPGYIFASTMVAYFGWWSFYMIVMASCGLSLPQRGYDTIFNYTMRGSVGKMIYKHGRRKSAEEYERAVCEDKFTVADLFIYMLCHASFVVVTVMVSLISFEYQLFNAFCCLASVGIAIDNGARRYTYYVLHLNKNLLKKSLSGLGQGLAEP